MDGLTQINDIYLIPEMCLIIIELIYYVHTNTHKDRKIEFNI